MVYVILFQNGRMFMMPVRINLLPNALQDVYAPWEGKTVMWDHGEIREYVQ
jgi:hypothetical protein